MMLRNCLIVCCYLFYVCSVRGDGPQDNLADKVRQVPPPGIKITDEDRADLTEGAMALGKEIAALETSLKGKPPLLELVPDVRIYYNAVRYALKYDEFFKLAEVGVARKLLQQGFERAKHLREGQAPWTTATGLVVRGYISKIDGSVQPYGLVVPASYRPGSAVQHRMDIWFHGRGETLSELNFIDGRQKAPGEFTPPHAFVLHPYGRYCNANHFAGEIDTFEAMDHLRKTYPIDEDRIVIRGFSMGGAACWNFAVHYADRWAAAAPGAGFSETPDFLKVFQKEELKPTWWERKLWHLYDCNDWAINLSHCPTVAYSGEKDIQKQAADVMAKALEAEGMKLVHVIGPATGHSYHPTAKAEINRRIDSIANKGRDRMPRHVRFTTWTLRYPQLAWVRVDGLERHWEQAYVDAKILDGHTVKVETKNVTALTLVMPAGYCPLGVTRPPNVELNGVPVTAAPVLSDRSWVSHFNVNAKPRLLRAADDGSVRKRPGLQGPIDDAFMDKFMMVRPTGQPLNDKIGAWTKAELEHAVDHWRKQFRGELQPKDDTQISDADIASSNLILWGDPQSNRILAKIATDLPIGWDREGVHLGGKQFEPDAHVPVLIFPNPLNPKKYVVLNSGFTFREYDYLNNARQVPKLPDWAILDIRQPRTSRAPALIVEAGFFDEEWRLREKK